MRPILCWIALVGVIVLGAVPAPLARAGTKPTAAEKCAAAKCKLAGKKIAAVTECDAKALMKGVTVDPVCVSRAQANFMSACTKTEATAKGACVPTGDALMIAGTVDAHRLDLAQMLDYAGTNTHSTCTAEKLRAAGDKGACKLNCMARATAKTLPLDGPKMVACLTKCSTRFAAAFTKAEKIPKAPQTTHCFTTGDAVEVEAKVDAFITDVCVPHVAAAIGPGGGTVSLPGGPSIEIPADALLALTTITIAASSMQAPVTALTPVFQFRPAGTLFATPVTVRFTVPAGTTSAAIYWTTRGSVTEYESVATTIDGTTAMAEVTHFSSGFVAAPCKDDATCIAATVCKAGGSGGGSCVKGGPACCKGTCVDLKADDNNCGKCGHVCLGTEACGVGVCVCAGKECHLLCVDDKTDPGNCGGCDQVCPANVPCCGGSCCAPGNACCWGPIIDQVNGTCVNVATDIHNCGRCGGDCVAFNGPDWVCTNGTCTCPSNRTPCGSDCVDLQTDPQNCGACGHACTSIESCTAGTCQSCPSGQIRCWDTCTDTQTDPKNCGACGNACGGNQTCSNGSCICPNNQTLCGSDCVDLQTDPQNCGACGNCCTSSQTCTAGTCCPSGQANCAGICTNTQTDWNNCGACGNACDVNVGEICCGGTCTNIWSDPNNCDACGHVCSPFYEVCWGAPASACMCCRGQCTNTLRDLKNCGSCGNDCSYTPGCGLNRCCDGACADPSDIAHCNFCGPCSSGQQCSCGACFWPEP